MGKSRVSYFFDSRGRNSIIIFFTLGIYSRGRFKIIIILITLGSKDHKG